MQPTKPEVLLQFLRVSSTRYRPTTWAFVCALWLVALCGRAALVGAASSPSGTQEPTAATKSTMTGVYTTEQATAGEKIYGNICTGCHNLGSHSGQVFAVKWKGRPLSDLYEQINFKMPEDDPGSLSPAESAQLVAYILKANGNPPGTQPLSSDMAELKKLLIETK
jgi:mono/diheme cytochrome c family protein